MAGQSNCASCGVALTPGAKFCHDCGATVGAPVVSRMVARRGRTTTSSRSNLPWIVAGVAFVALVVIFAAQRAGQSSAAATPAAPPPSGAAAVDVASMTPQERASRLFDRIMRLSEEGKADSAAFFASMAMGVYESLGSLDLDTRYDNGRVAVVGGSPDIAQAQADSILRESPDHLLGLILASAAAGARGNDAQRASFENRLLTVETRERARSLDEYQRHKADIDAALAAVRSRR